MMVVIAVSFQYLQIIWSYYIFCELQVEILVFLLIVFCSILVAEVFLVDVFYQLEKALFLT